MNKRILLPGSEWLFIKIYSGYKSCDTLLIEFIQPLMEDFFKKDLIDKYFFIRYGDPEHHLRLRLHIKDLMNYSYILHRFNVVLDHLMENKLIFDCSINTYTRELERYGSFTVENSEDLFYIDSDSTIDILRGLSDYENAEEKRWLLSIKLIDDTLTSFGYDMEGKAHILKMVSESFCLEFGFDKHVFTKQLNDKFRTHRVIIESCLSNDEEDGIISEILTSRKVKLSELAQIIKNNLSKNSPLLSMEYLIQSYMHMTMNRLFRSENRKYELVIYYFMSKCYHSLLAQKLYRK